MAKSSIPKSNIICQVPGCYADHLASGFCERHYAQNRNHGKVFSRTIYDSNKFIVEGNVCFIQLYDKDCNAVSRAVIDMEDLNLVKNLKWCVGAYGYVTSGSRKKRKMLAHVIMHPVPDGFLVDHKDRDILNNRRNNLRYATVSQNCANSLRATNTSGFKGVCRHKKNCVWIASIQHKKRQYYIGSFDSKEEAALAYNKKALELFGEFATLNEV